MPYKDDKPKDVKISPLKAYSVLIVSAMSDPNAVFGWRCAEILGVSGDLSVMGAETFRKFVDGVVKAQELFGNSNFEFTDEQWKKLYSAFAKMSLWDGVDEKKVKRHEKRGIR